MSIDIQEAKNKLSLLEQVSNEPVIIFTELFSDGLKDSNLLNIISVNGNGLDDYIQSSIQNLDMFNGTLIHRAGYLLTIFLPSLKFGRYKQYQQDDEILKIDLKNKTYEVFNGCKDNYIEVMNTKYELEVLELSEFWKRYENFNFRNRIKNAFKSLMSKKSLNVRIKDFLYTLSVDKHYVNRIVQIQKRDIENRNNYAKQQYEDHIEVQNFYREHAIHQINLIDATQDKIKQYLIQLGYIEADSSIY